MIFSKTIFNIINIIFKSITRSISYYSFIEYIFSFFRYYIEDYQYLVVCNKFDYPVQSLELNCKISIQQPYHTTMNNSSLKYSNHFHETYNSIAVSVYIFRLVSSIFTDTIMTVEPHYKHQWYF